MYFFLLVFIDIILLVLGYVVDGLNLNENVLFLFEIVIKSVLWDNFIDLEFGI